MDRSRTPRLGVAADAATARTLAVPARSACLVVERRTWRGKETLTKVRQVFRGDANNLIARFGLGGR